MKKQQSPRSSGPLGPRYSSLLDGEHIKLSAEQRNVSPATHVQDVVAALKLHALLGTPIVISDVQLIDSAAMLSCFTDVGFVRVLRADPSWIEFRAGGSKDTAPTRRRLVLSGLARTQQKGWVSSAFGDTPRFKVIAEQLLEGETLDWSAPGLVDQRLSAVAAGVSDVDRGLVRGLVRGLSHFLSSQDAVVSQSPVVPNPPTYYGVIQEALNRGDLESEDRRLLEQACGFIELAMPDPDARPFRSKLQPMLATAGTPVLRLEIWHTVVHAWNVALQRSLDAAGGIYGALRHGAQIAAYVDDVSDLRVANSVAMNAKPSLGERVLLLFADDYDYGALSWERVATLIEETTETRLGYGRSLASGEPEAAHDALVRHRARLGAVVAAHSEVLPPANWKVLSAVAMAEVGAHGVPGVATGSLAIYEAARRGLQKLREYQVVSTLRRRGP